MAKQKDFFVYPMIGILKMSIKTFLKNKIRNATGINEMNNKVNLLLSKNPNLEQATNLVATHMTAQYIEECMLMATPVNSSTDVFDFVFTKYPINSGLILEFGVFTGKSINYIAKKTKLNVYGFDSFEGLPENWRSGFSQGSFDLKGELPKCESNVRLIKGWFEQTIPIFLTEQSDRVSFIHVDCDLYSSTKTIFEMLNKQLAETVIIVFDEYFNYPGWKKHEHLAFMEFIGKTGYKYDYICYNKNHEQVAVRLTTT